MEPNSKPKRKRGGENNWIGLVIFFVIAFGSSVAKFITGLIFQITGLTVGSNALSIGLVALIVLAVAVSAIGSAVRAAGRINTGSETRLPTGPISPTQMGAPTWPVQPPAAQLPPTQLPGGPRFEPMINPRVLVIGVVGLILFGGVFLAILAIFG